MSCRWLDIVSCRPRYNPGTLLASVHGSTEHGSTTNGDHGGSGDGSGDGGGGIDGCSSKSGGRGEGRGCVRPEFRDEVGVASIGNGEVCAVRGRRGEHVSHATGHVACAMEYEAQAEGCAEK